jgi:membrane-associated phospholipid phosphatase
MTTVRADRAARGAPVVRTWHDAVLAAVGAGLLVLSAVPVHEHSISAAETDIFRAVNDHTVLPFVVVWPIMQAGNFIAVPVAAAVAAMFRRWRLAFAILAAGAATYFLAKVVKGIVERGRPAALLDDVTIRGAAALGRGYVSGHAAVVTLLVVLAWPYLSRGWRWVLVVAALFVCLSRVYVAAHLPLDILGGAALGLTVGAIARLVFGRPPP